MRGILADHNNAGQVARLVQCLQQEPWREIWADLNLHVPTFAALGLAAQTSDAVLWQTCQQHQLTLITNNRNGHGPDSLEATIRAHNTPASLPVFTLASPDRVLHDPAYRERVAERLLEYLIDMDKYRGTGRLYLP
jgi:hypothetical protein